MILYLTKFGKELDLISGENCMVIALGKTEFRRFGFDKKMQASGVKERVSEFVEGIWQLIVKEHISTGHSVRVAQLFNIGFDDFPCLVLFRDIRSSEHIVVTLKGMTADDIAVKMRSVFSIIQEAATNRRDPLLSMQNHRNNEVLLQKGKSIISELRSFAGKSLEMAMEAWIKASIK